MSRSALARCLRVDVAPPGAMLGRGSRSRRGGGGRTTSFRRSFRLAYANRVGERLRWADAEALSATGRSQGLVPVLRDHAERVDAAFGELFPETHLFSPSVSDHEGWVLGRAAADLAHLDVRKALDQEMWLRSDA